MSSQTNQIKVVILYRVIQNWRAPFFEKLSKDNLLNVKVFYGPDFKGTKVISTKKEFTFKKNKLASLKIKLGSSNGSIMMPFSPFLFFRLIIERPDVIITEGASNLINAFTGFIYSIIFRKKIIWWSLGKLEKREYDIKRRILDFFIKMVERNATILTYSQRGVDYYQKLGISDHKIFKAVNVVDTQEICKMIDVDKKQEIKESYDDYHKKYDFVILYTGVLIKEKSIDVLLMAQKRLIDQGYKNVGLLIVGDGLFRKELEDLCNSQNIYNVEFLGKRISDNYKFFGAADLFVLPGLGGLAISEAMCYSLPVIASIGDGCEVDLINSNNGIVDIDMTIDKLTEYIKIFINNPEKSKIFGLESRKIIDQKYNTQNYINNIINAIKN